MKIRKILGVVAVLGAVGLPIVYQVMQDDKAIELQSTTDTPYSDNDVETVLAQEKRVSHGPDDSLVHTSNADAIHEEESEVENVGTVRQHLGDPLRDIDDLPEAITPIRIGDPLRSVDDLPTLSNRIALGNPLRSVDDLPPPAQLERLGDKDRDVDASPPSSPRQALGKGRTIEE